MAGVMDNKARLIANAPFASIILGLTSKSEAAQCTFIHRLLQAVSGDVLQTTHKYAKEEIKRRVKTAEVSGKHGSGEL